MAQASKSKRSSRRRRVTDTVLDIAIGGPALAADKAKETVDRVVEVGQEALRRGRRTAEEGGRSNVRQTLRSASGDHDARPYENRTREELYELAAERDIEGRSSMSKKELIAALREQS